MHYKTTKLVKWSHAPVTLLIEGVRFTYKKLARVVEGSAKKYS